MTVKETNLFIPGDVNEFADLFRGRVEDILKEHLVDNRPPSVETLARYISEELATIIVEESEEVSEDYKDSDYLDSVWEQEG